MKVILKQDVKGLGREGDLKDVKDGYARNFLLPTGRAMLADKGALANWERHREQREDRDRLLRADAEAVAEQLNALKLEIPVKAGERGRLFGAVSMTVFTRRKNSSGEMRESRATESEYTPNMWRPSPRSTVSTNQDRAARRSIPKRARLLKSRQATA